MAEVDCHNCGETVEKPQRKIDRNDRQFCSRECYHDSGRPDMEGENNPNPSKSKATVVCEHCGGEFEVYPYREDSARFCGRECKDQYMAGRSGESTPAYRGAKETHTCDVCGDQFEEYDYRNDRKYCSESCYREAAKDIFSGDGNPVWRGGYGQYYGPNWSEQREATLQRDGYCCQNCGVSAGEIDHSLHVHHKNRLGWFKEEYDAPEWYEKANRLENLTTLCRSCHMKTEWSNGPIQQ